jgi:hypothetical protein
MQTGKILGIGAVLSAGLLATHVASASVQLEVFDSGTATQISLTNLGSGVYSAVPTGSGNYSWTSLEVSVLGPGALGFSVQGLKYSGTTVATASFLATGTGFTYLNANPNTLTSTGGGGYTGTGSFVSMSQGGYAAASNSAFDRTGDSTGGLSPSTPAGGGAFTTSTESNTSVSDLSSAPGYSLTYAANFAFDYFSGANEGNTFGTAADPAGGTVSILGGTASAVTLPGSGPLTVIGGLMVVGGLAIRRRMKV